MGVLDEGSEGVVEDVSKLLGAVGANKTESLGERCEIADVGKKDGGLKPVTPTQ